MNPHAAPRRSPRRRAALALIAGGAAVIAALPAHAATSGHRQAGSRHPIAAAAATTSTGSVRPSYPLPRHRHPDVAKRTAAPAPAAHSKRDGGQSELAVPSVRAATVLNPAARWPASPVALAAAAGSTAARAPPARQ